MRDAVGEGRDAGGRVKHKTGVHVLYESRRETTWLSDRKHALWQHSLVGKQVLSRVHTQETGLVCILMQPLFAPPPLPFFFKLSSRLVHSSLMLRFLVASGNRTTWLSERNYTVGFKHHKYLGWHNKSTWLHLGKHSDPGPNVIQVIIHHSLLLERKVTHPKHLIHAPQPSHCVSNWIVTLWVIKCFSVFFQPSELNLEMFFICKPVLCIKLCYHTRMSGFLLLNV